MQFSIVDRSHLSDYVRTSDAAEIHLVGLRRSLVSTPLRTTLQSVEGNKRLYLVAKDFMFSAQPGVVYDVYLNKADSPVGAISFFGAGHSGMSAHKFWSADVTARAKSASAQGKAGDPLKVKFVPAGKPAEGAKPVIGSLSLVEL